MNPDAAKAAHTAQAMALITCLPLPARPGWRQAGPEPARGLSDE